MSELTGRELGFTSPAVEQKRSIRRTGIELAATIGLAVALIVAATAVSIGMAHAQAVGRATHHDGFPLAVAAVGLGVVMAGWGGMTALVTRATKLPRG